VKALRPLTDEQRSNLFYEAVYFYEFVSDNIMAEVFRERGLSEDTIGWAGLCMSGHLENQVRARYGLEPLEGLVTPELPQYASLESKAWTRAYLEAMKWRRQHYSQFEPNEVLAAFARHELSTLGRNAKEPVVSDIVRAAAQATRDQGILAGAKAA